MSSLAIKSGWWSQLFSSEVAARLPRLKLLMWMECMTFDALGRRGSRRLAGDRRSVRPRGVQGGHPDRDVFASG